MNIERLAKSKKYDIRKMPFGHLVNPLELKNQMTKNCGHVKQQIQ